MCLAVHIGAFLHQKVDGFLRTQLLDFILCWRHNRIVLSYLTIIYSRKQTSIHNHYNDHHLYFMKTTYEIFFTFILQSNEDNLSMTTHYKKISRSIS